MTTAATVVGHFPLVLATGPGAGARNSIGIMLVTGMIIGTMFTLFVVPSIYVLVAKRHGAEAKEADAENEVPDLAAAPPRVLPARSLLPGPRPCSPPAGPGSASPSRACRPGIRASRRSF